MVGFRNQPVGATSASPGLAGRGDRHLRTDFLLETLSLLADQGGDLQW